MCAGLPSEHMDAMDLAAAAAAAAAESEVPVIARPSRVMLPAGLDPVNSVRLTSIPAVGTGTSGLKLQFLYR